VRSYIVLLKGISRIYAGCGVSQTLNNNQILERRIYHVIYKSIILICSINNMKGVLIMFKKFVAALLAITLSLGTVLTTGASVFEEKNSKDPGLYVFTKETSNEIV
jgi:hypothetical protein